MITLTARMLSVVDTGRRAAELNAAASVFGRAKKDFSAAVARGYGVAFAREKLEAARKRFDLATAAYEVKPLSPVIRDDSLRQNADDDLYDLN